MKAIRLNIWHDGRQWVASNDDFTFRGNSLDELDQNVRRYVLSRESLSRGDTFRVYMYFDNRTIPEWIRPYAQHYFDRILEIKT